MTAAPQARGCSSTTSRRGVGEHEEENKKKKKKKLRTRTMTAPVAAEKAADAAAAAAAAAAAEPEPSSTLSHITSSSSSSPPPSSPPSHHHSSSSPPTTQDSRANVRRQSLSLLRTMAWISLPLLAVLAGIQIQAWVSPDSAVVRAHQQQQQQRCTCQQQLEELEEYVLPAQAQVIDQRSFNIWPCAVPPVSVTNGTQIFHPPGISAVELAARPFHIYDEEFYSIIGSHPTLTLIAETRKNPMFHEAVVWYRPTDEVFFVQNAGAKAAGTGLNKSSIVQKISLAQVDALRNLTNATQLVDLTYIPVNTTVVNPNGATNYNGEILYMAEGSGADFPSNAVLMHPRAPYNTTVVLDNYFGRQFSSLNDVGIHPVSKDVYFTDTLYGYLQDFRPAPGLRNQLYRWNPRTGAVTVVADGFVLPNGFTFSPDGKYAYISDTGMNKGFYGYNFTAPASIYRYDVQDDGTLDNRKLFAFIDSGVPDGVHCDSEGNVYAGCGDGIQVWNPSGTLIGKIYLGTGSANFEFAGDGRMVICAETRLYYATFNSSGSYVEDMM